MNPRRDTSRFLNVTLPEIAMTPKQANEIKHRLRQQGTTVKGWALAHGFRYRDVSEVLRGLRRGHYGAGREIYLALGLDPDAENEARRAA
jgi:gp16 family phage-associated protein